MYKIKVAGDSLSLSFVYLSLWIWIYQAGGRINSLTVSIHLVQVPPVFLAILNLLQHDLFVQANFPNTIYLTHSSPLPHPRPLQPLALNTPNNHLKGSLHLKLDISFFSFLSLFDPFVKKQASKKKEKKNKDRENQNENALYFHCTMYNECSALLTVQVKKKKFLQPTNMRAVWRLTGKKVSRLERKQTSRLNYIYMRQNLSLHNITIYMR